MNAYMYCVGDPVNFSDPTGHMGWSLPKFLLARIRPRAPSPPPVSLPHVAARPNEYQRLPVASPSRAEPITGTQPASTPTHARLPPGQNTTDNPIPISASVSRNRERGLPDNYRPYEARSTSPEPTISYAEYMRGQRAMEADRSVLLSRRTEQNFSLPTSNSRQTAIVQASNPIFAVPANRRLLITQPAVPDRLLPNNMMRRADGSTYYDIAAAQEQVRGGKGRRRG